MLADGRDRGGLWYRVLVARYGVEGGHVKEKVAEGRVGGKMW